MTTPSILHHQLGRQRWRYCEWDARPPRSSRARRRGCLVGGLTGALNCPHSGVAVPALSLSVGIDGGVGRGRPVGGRCPAPDSEDLVSAGLAFGPVPVDLADRGLGRCGWSARFAPGGQGVTGLGCLHSTVDPQPPQPASTALAPELLQHCWPPRCLKSSSGCFCCASASTSQGHRSQQLLLARRKGGSQAMQAPLPSVRAGSVSQRSSMGMSGR
jgi:hypothetical protein